MYRLRYRSSFHQNENFIQEIESLLVSLENFTIKKKKIDLAPLEIEASNEFSNLVSRRGFEAAESSGRVGSAFESLPLSMHLPLPPHSSQPASVPLPGRARPRFYVELFVANTVSGGRMSEETETHWHRFHAHFLFFTFEIS